MLNKIGLYIRNHFLGLTLLVIFFALYLYPIILYWEHPIPFIHPDEERVLALGEKYLNDLLYSFKLNLLGMNSYTGSLMYYTVGAVSKLFGSSVNMLRIFSLSITFLNFCLLYRILINFVKSDELKRMFIVLLSLPFLIIYSRMAFEFSTILITFLLIGYYFYKIKKNFHLSNLFFFLAVFVHPICISVLIFLFVLEFRKNNLKKMLTVISASVLFLMSKIVYISFFVNESRVSDLYLSLSKILSMLFVFYDSLEGHKVILSVVGGVDYRFLPLVLVVILYNIICRSFNINLRSFFAILATFLFLLLSTPALSYQYFLYPILIFMLFLVYKTPRTIIGNTLLILLVFQNVLNVSLNFFNQYSRTRGRGLFYNHEYIDSGIRNRNPYHSFYFIDLSRDLEHVVNYGVSEIITNDGFILKVLDFHLKKERGVQSRFLSPSFKFDNDKKYAYIIYSYHKAYMKLKINGRLFELSKNSDLSKVLVYYSNEINKT